MLEGDKGSGEEQGSGGNREGWWGMRSGFVLHRLAGEGRSQKAGFEQSPEGGKGGRHADIWRKSVQATGTAGAKALG